MPSSSFLAGPTYVLVVVATLMLQVAIYDRQGPVAHEWVHLGVVMAIAALNRQSSIWRRGRLANAVATTSFAALVTMPFLGDFFLRSASLWGNPAEIQIVLSLRNMMIGLAARNRDPRSLKFASFASCFIALFSILWLMNRINIVLLFTYSVVGMWWLMGAYWDRLSGCFLSRSERSIPWKPVCGAALLVTASTLVLLPLATGQSFTTAIRGIFPSSGGSQWQDEHAFGGVGDGPQMVSAKDNASGFGPIESELFLESKMPSLYDVLNEFSEPPKNSMKKKGRHRAIPLAPGQMQQNHKRRGENQQAGREFSAVRQRTNRRPDVPDLKSHALLQVSGRVPLHLGLYAYDQWDGQKLTSSGGAVKNRRELELHVQEGKNWAKYVELPVCDCLTHPEQHELRIINLNTDRVPSPPNLTGVHIDRIHTARFFRPSQDGMLAVDMEFLPQLSVLHVESLRRRSGQTPRLVSSPSPVSGELDLIASLAVDWTAGVARGWPQVEAVCSRLRDDYSLDPDAMAPVDVDDAADFFLLKSKRGPDYLFATSAALLLRTLGYETRVVSGFYADPEEFDRTSRLTSVYADDAHFWVEVLAIPNQTDPASEAPKHHWIAVEPTPGYEVLLAPESLWSQLLSRTALTWHALKRNPISTLACFALLGVTWAWRASVGDTAVTCWWQLFHRWGNVRHRVTSTLRLLDRRARLHGHPRANEASLSRWNLSPSFSNDSSLDWELRFIEVANWALYGGESKLTFTSDEVNALCAQAAAIGMKPPRRRSLGFFTSSETTR